MRYLSVTETAKKWHISERSVRNYCVQGRINGAFLTGKTWNIPENTEKPERSNKRKEQTTLLDIVQLIMESPNITKKEIANKIGKSERTVKNKVASLKEKGYIQRLNGKWSGYDYSIF